MKESSRAKDPPPGSGQRVLVNRGGHYPGSFVLPRLDSSVLANQWRDGRMGQDQVDIGYTLAVMPSQQ